MAGLVPQAIVLALGAGVVGGHDALRLLLELAGHGAPAMDLAVCIALISALTALVLGAMLLSRFLLKSRAGAAADAVATDYLFAQATFLVTACLLVAESGGVVVSSAHHLFELGADNPVLTGTVLLVVIVVGGAAAAGGGSIPCTTPLLRFVRAARNASGAGGGGAGMRRFGKAAVVALVVVFSLACLLLLAILCAPPGRVSDVGELSCSA